MSNPNDQVTSGGPYGQNEYVQYRQCPRCAGWIGLGQPHSCWNTAPTLTPPDLALFNQCQQILYRLDRLIELLESK